MEFPRVKVRRHRHDDQTRVHLITGGFPVGSLAGQDMDYAWLRILHILSELLHIIATMSNDFARLEKCLLGCC